MNAHGNGNIEAGLQSLFAGEIKAQHGRSPSLELIRLMARIDERARKQSKLDRIQGWCEILAVGGSAGLLAAFWSQLTSGLESLLPLAHHNLSWASVLGLAASFLALLICWPRAFSQEL